MFRLSSVARSSALALLLAVVVATLGCVGTAGHASSSAASDKTPPATGQLSVSVQSLNFGNVAVGANAMLPVTFANTGAASLVISQQSVTGTGFSAGGIGSNLTLTANQSATLDVNFRPSSTGSDSGSVVLSSSASSSSIVIALTGAGMQDAHSVTLSWNPSVSAVTGYFVYRGASSSGPWTRLSASAVTAISYLDSTVQSGQLYFYAVSSLGADGIESVVSAAVSAAIPSP